MSKKPAPLAFQPAPRPQARLSAADAARLSEAAADLGFTRPVSVAEPAQGAAKAEAGRPARRAPAARAAAPPKPAAPEPNPGPMASLKIEVPDKAWVSLKLEAVRRRVTVRFLILEALARQGYEIDLAEVPQDGRRLR